MKNSRENHSTGNNCSLSHDLTFIYSALFGAVGIALAVHIINTGFAQIPLWVLLVTAVMLFCSLTMCIKSGDYNGITAGVIGVFGVLFMMWIIPNLPVPPGTTPLDQMMMRIFSSFIYMPLLAGILSIIISLANLPLTKNRG